MLCRYETQSCFLLAFLAVTAFFISDAQGQVSPPTRLRYNVVSPDSVQISWKAPKGQFTGYKLLVTPSSVGYKEIYKVFKGELKREHYFSQSFELDLPEPSPIVSSPEKKKKKRF